MAQEGALVESLPDRPLTTRERDALEQHDRIQSIMPQDIHFDSEYGRVMYAALFIGEDWVTAVNYQERRGWEVIYTGEMEDNIVADGFLTSEDLHEEHPIQKGMEAMAAARASEEAE